MELEKQVCGLELAKRLKGLGVKQRSYFHWWNANHGALGRGWELSSFPPTNATGDDECYSAFTVAELGGMLPRPLYNGRLRHRFGFDEDGWYIEVVWPRRGSNSFHAATEADARAKMLIYLLENKII